GTTYCPDCQVPVESQTRDEVGKRLRQQVRDRGELTLLAPMVKNRKGFHTDVAEWAANHGYKQVRADGKLYLAREHLRLERFREHDVEIVTGVLVNGTKARRAGESNSSPAQSLIDETLKLGSGLLYALDSSGQVSVHSTERSCPKCGRSFAALD